MRILFRHFYIYIAIALMGAAHQTIAQGIAFTYQGRVTDNGTNFSGAGQFEFALVTSTDLPAENWAHAD